MRALVVTDLQCDFMPGGALPVPHADEVVAVANRVARRFELVVATQDWHPRNHGSFASNHPGRKPGDVVELGGVAQVLWPDHCVQHTRGAELVAGLDTSRLAGVFHKGIDPEIDSYSALYDNAHRRSTGLSEWLKARGVDEVWLLGVATDYCVRATALDARREGLRAVLVEDGCRGVELKGGDSEAAIQEMRANGVEVVRSAAA